MLANIANIIISAPSFKGKNRLLRKLFRRLDGQVLRSKYGVLLRVRAEDYTNWACISGAYARDYDDVYAEILRLRPGMAFVDIGANAGLFSMVAAKRVRDDGVVLAFEPNPKVFAQLQDHAVINKVRNVHMFQAAVGANSGTAFFKSGPANHTGVGRIDADGDIEVKVVSFANEPSLYELIGSRKVVVKIDVEGAEAEVVKGLSALLASGQVEVVVLEVDQDNLLKFHSSINDIYETMRVAGFSGKIGRSSAVHYNEIFSAQ